jgi:hypothetical protein
MGRQEKKVSLFRFILSSRFFYQWQVFYVLQRICMYVCVCMYVGSTSDQMCTLIKNPQYISRQYGVSALQVPNNNKLGI